MSSVLKFIKESATKQRTRKIPGRELNAPLKKTIYSGSLGVEIEIEGANLPAGGYLEGIEVPSGSVWQAKNDGSLRNGLEYVLSQPCKVEEVGPLIHGLYEVFKKRGTRLTPSNRCSIHVHYNVGGLKVNTVTSIIALWTIFEEPLLRWWGQERFKNHFCLSSKDESGSLTAWESFLTTGRLPEQTGLRYTALNLVAIKKYGSLEFRGGGAVSVPEKGVVWTQFLYALCEYAKQKYPDPRQIAYDISERGPRQILFDICGDLFARFGEEVVATVPDFDRACSESFYNFQPILFDFPWQDWLEEIDKPYVPNPFAKGGKTLQDLARFYRQAAEINEIQAVRVRP